MNATTTSVGSPRSAPSGVVTSGVVELGAAALSGWVYALAKYDPERGRALGIKSPARIRQWHLDLAALGTATVALGLAVPDAPKPVRRALAIGAWSNAMMFLPLAFRPEALDDPAYRTAGIASFVSTSVGFTGMAVTALRRHRAARR